MTVQPTIAPVRVFISYSHKDDELRKRLTTHLTLLRRQQVIDTWDDRAIEGGEAWDERIREKLEGADVILLLVSPDFVASEFCWGKEMKRAMERHQQGTARVVPIIVRPVDLTGAPFMALQALPRDARPVITWPHEDEAWKEVALGIRQVAATLRGPRDANAAAPTGGPATTQRPTTAAGQVPTAASLRKLLTAVLSADDFDAFCSDHFPAVKRRLSSGMQQVAKITLLLEHAKHAEILRQLREALPDEVAENEGLLRFIP